MAKTRVYVAFDYDDLDVKNSLKAQSELPQCPFELIDNSINRAVADHWQREARRRMGECDCVIVLCGEQTHQAKGVAIELQIAQELRKPYFLLAGTRKSRPTSPPNARTTDKIWHWRWPTVQALLEGRTPPPDAAVQ